MICYMISKIMNLVSLQFINIINIRSYETVKSAAHRVNALHENKEKVNGYSFQILTLVLFVYIWRIFNSCWKFEWTIKFKTTLFRFPNPLKALNLNIFQALQTPQCSCVCDENSNNFSKHAPWRITSLQQVSVSCFSWKQAESLPAWTERSLSKNCWSGTCWAGM